MSMTMLPVAEARDQLSKLVNDAQRYNERFQISRNGRPAAVLMSQDDYDGLMETLEILADPIAVSEMSEGIADLEAGRWVTGAELARRMNALRDQSHG